MQIIFVIKNKKVKSDSSVRDRLLSYQSVRGHVLPVQGSVHPWHQVTSVGRSKKLPWTSYDSN